MSEIERLRRAQSRAVMPLIGPLLDAWEGLSNDAKGVLQLEAATLCEYLVEIDAAMDADDSVTPADRI